MKYCEFYFTSIPSEFIVPYSRTVTVLAALTRIDGIQ